MLGISDSAAVAVLSGTALGYAGLVQHMLFLLCSHDQVDKLIMLLFTGLLVRKLTAFCLVLMQACTSVS